MRAIEEKMCKAIAQGRNLHEGNTSVEHKDGFTFVYLHGHLICQILKNGKRLFSNCGYETNTTKSRLNALGADIYQKNFVWYCGKTGKEFKNDF